MQMQNESMLHPLPRDDHFDLKDVDEHWPLADCIIEKYSQTKTVATDRWNATAWFCPATTRHPLEAIVGSRGACSKPLQVVETQHLVQCDLM